MTTMTCARQSGVSRLRQNKPWWRMPAYVAERVQQDRGHDRPWEDMLNRKARGLTADAKQKPSRLRGRGIGAAKGRERAAV